MPICSHSVEMSLRPLLQSADSAGPEDTAASLSKQGLKLKREECPFLFTPMMPMSTRSALGLAGGEKHGESMLPVPSARILQDPGKTIMGLTTEGASALEPADNRAKS